MLTESAALIKQVIDQSHNIKFDESEEHFLINNYSWESIENVLKSCDNNVDTGWADLISQCDLLKLKEATSKYSKIGILGESIYGSYSRVWRQVSNKLMSKVYLKNKRKTQHNKLFDWKLTFRFREMSKIFKIYIRVFKMFRWNKKRQKYLLFSSII